MKVHYHIGVPKTATSTLQDFLALNRGRLRRRGILYPIAAGRRRSQTRLAAYAADDDNRSDVHRFNGLRTPAEIAEFRAGLKAGLLEEIGRTRRERVVFSCEHLAARTGSVDEVARLKGLLDELRPEYRVIVYLRRQDLQTLSTYSTAIKTGSSKEFSAYLDERSSRELLDYAALCDRWSAVFGKDALQVNTFEPSQWKNGDIVDDFCARFGLDDLDGFKRPPAENQSLDPATLEFARLLNLHLPHWRPGEPNPVRGGIREALEAIAGADRVRISAARAREIVERFAAQNRHVALNYLGRVDGVLFRDPIAEPVAEVHPSLGVEQAVELAAKLWMHQQELVQRLRRRLQKGEPGEDAEQED